MPEGQSPDFNCHTEIEKCHLNVWFKEDFFFFELRLLGTVLCMFFLILWHRLCVCANVGVCECVGARVCGYRYVHACVWMLRLNAWFCKRLNSLNFNF